MYNSVEIAKRIKETAKEKGITVAKVLEESKLGSNTMSNMKTSMPKTDTLAKIADCLDVSVDYLLGRDKKILTVDSEDSELEPIAIKASKSDWKRILSRLSEENLNRLQEYAELLLLKQVQDVQED